ncbi:capsular polysaccharide synthesis protein [Companilactobacillus hulinensis]|uniref:capsular polysaccharide synthesis protein n=1 Tax=Companilactobacillus hulinensis TaxID=2486007 RepID=UPI000F797CAC|nr:capsular polysaccharide synthesis protein [Companilactobacillus hulinensis]
MSQAVLNTYLKYIYRSENLLKLITHGKKSILPGFVYNPYHRMVERNIQKTIQDVPTTFWHDELIKVDPVLTDKIIWVMWWQVRDVPPFIKQNIALMRARLNKRVILLNQENIADFIDIPEHIQANFDAGKIKYTTFSDYIRTKILFEYGGVWLDSTMYVAEDNNFLNQLNFVDHDLITIKGIPDFGSKFIPKGRWVIYCLGGHSGQMIFKFVNDCLTYYLENNLTIPDYFLTDYIFDIAYKNNIGGFKEKLNKVPSNNVNCEQLSPVMNQKFDEKLLEKITKNTSVFKLSNKVAYRSRTKQQDKTFYSYLYEQHV